jgi:hypothetical protein
LLGEDSGDGGNSPGLRPGLPRLDGFAGVDSEEMDVAVVSLVR